MSLGTICYSYSYQILNVKLSTIKIVWVSWVCWRRPNFLMESISLFLAGSIIFDKKSDEVIVNKRWLFSHNCFPVYIQILSISFARLELMLKYKNMNMIKSLLRWLLPLLVKKVRWNKFREILLVLVYKNLLNYFFIFIKIKFLLIKLIIFLYLIFIIIF